MMGTSFQSVLFGCHVSLSDGYQSVSMTLQDEWQLTGLIFPSLHWENGKEEEEWVIQPAESGEWWERAGCSSCKKAGMNVCQTVAGKTQTPGTLQVLLLSLTRVIRQCSTKNEVSPAKECIRSFSCVLLDRTEHFANCVWFFLLELTLLANVRLWQARSLETTIVPSGPLVLSVPLNCVHYTVLDNKQKDG